MSFGQWHWVSVSFGEDSNVIEMRVDGGMNDRKSPALKGGGFTAPDPRTNAAPLSVGSFGGTADFLANGPIGGPVSGPNELRLIPELIPEPLWRLSAKRVLARNVWKAIRTRTLGEAGETCAACGTVIPGGRYMVCDEVWSYDEGRGVATLAGFRILCPACDKARHFGLAGLIDRAELALEQLATVNGIDVAAARRLQRDAKRDWVRRSGLAWTIEVDAALLEAWPQLAVLAGERGVPGEGRERL